MALRALLTAPFLSMLLVTGTVAADTTPAPFDRALVVKPKASGSFYAAGDAGPPTAVSLAAFGGSAGDYVGVAVKGAYAMVYGETVIPLAATSVVFGEGTGFLAPLAGSTGSAVRDERCLRNPHDVALVNASNTDPTVLLRQPSDGALLKISAANCDFDHFENRFNWRVIITFPNRISSKYPRCPGKGGHGPGQGLDARTVDALFRTARRLGIPDTPVDLADRRARVAPPMPLPQYRGWYFDIAGGGKPCWGPHKSRFDGRDTRFHAGVDLFAPAGSPLTAPVGGRGFKTIAKGYGTIYAIAFKAGKPARDHILAFAHLSETRKDGAVKAGEVIGRAGCTGMPKAVKCGKGQTTLGLRSDHVHVELIVGATLGKDETRRDPVEAFGWTVR